MKKMKKLLITACIISLLIVGAITAQANIRIITSESDGSWAGVSCGSSAGNFVVIYDASSGNYYFFDAQPGAC